MQKSYEAPEIELFPVQNVIALSGTGDDNIAEWDFGGKTK